MTTSENITVTKSGIRVSIRDGKVTVDGDEYAIEGLSINDRGSFFGGLVSESDEIFA